MRRFSGLSTPRRSLIALLLALGGAGIFSVSSAFADAGNPITGSIRASAVDNGNGTITVYVRGQYNWLSHNSDCNFDRAATGVGIIWNDSTEPGYTVSKGAISAGVGISSLRSGDTANVRDQMVHPVDRGNQVEGYTAAGTDYPAGQQFADPAAAAPPTATQVAAWKGGCGREPLTATASKGSNPERTGLTCANGTTTCSGHPWGSWGYEKNNGTGKPLGYSHTYLSTALPSRICVNFYDVHGGGNAGANDFQVPNNAKEITVDQSGDNSIETNAFDVTNGANCISLAVDANIQITPATAVNPPNTTHTLTGHVNVNSGGGFVNAPNGTTINFTIVSGPGGFVGPSSCTTAGGTGSCTAVITSTAVGTTVVRASTDVLVGGVSLHRQTADGKAGDSADASKLWAQPSMSIVKNPKSQTVAKGGTATFEITVTNTGSVTLTDVVVTDPLSPNCNRTKADIPALASMAPGASVTYKCTKTNVQESFNNVAIATATPPAGPALSATDTAPVKIAPLTPAQKKKQAKKAKKKVKVVSHKKPKATG
jgi:uncharacterized repeat protein (TIGR01451 family)